MIPSPQGVFARRETWPLGALLAHGGDECLARVRDRFERDPAPMSALVQHRGMAPFILWLLDERELPAPSLREMLAPFEAIATGWAARRQLALGELDERAGRQAVRLLIIKGAAISLQLYPKTRLRVSRDVDVLCDPSELEKAGLPLPEWDEPGALRPHHAKPFNIQETPVEFHSRLTYFPDWGTLDDLIGETRNHTAFPHLRFPSCELVFTGSCLHVVSHALETPWDLVDLAMAVRHGAPDFARLLQLWERTRLGKFIWPVLCLCRWVNIPFPDSLPADVLGNLTRRERRSAQRILSLLCAAHFQRVRRDRLRCMLAGVSFPKHLARFLWGSIATTRGETGLSPISPRFWWQHCLALPKERLGRYFWE